MRINLEKHMNKSVSRYETTCYEVMQFSPFFEAPCHVFGRDIIYKRCYQIISTKFTFTRLMPHQ